MMVCYIAVPARIVGMPTDKSAKAARTRGSGRGAKLAGAAVTGLFGAIVCTPPYAIARGGILLLGSSALFPLGVALLVIGLMLEAGATGAVKAIKVSAKLLAGRSPQTPGGRAPSGLDGAAGHSSATSMFRLTGLRQAGDGDRRPPRATTARRPSRTEQAWMPAASSSNRPAAPWP
jgi:hypothetical protein